MESQTSVTENFLMADFFILGDNKKHQTCSRDGLLESLSDAFDTLIKLSDKCVAQLCGLNERSCLLSTLIFLLQSINPVLADCPYTFITIGSSLASLNYS